MTTAFCVDTCSKLRRCFPCYAIFPRPYLGDTCNIAEFGKERFGVEDPLVSDQLNRPLNIKRGTKTCFANPMLNVRFRRVQDFSNGEPVPYSQTLRIVIHDENVSHVMTEVRKAPVGFYCVYTTLARLTTLIRTLLRSVI